jgi:hypothetical protein
MKYKKKELKISGCWFRDAGCWFNPEAKANKQQVTSNR